MTDQLPEFIRTMLYAEHHRLLHDKVGRSMKRIVTAGVADDFIRQQIISRVEKHRYRQAFAGPIEMPQLTSGDFIPGLDVQGNEIRFPRHFLNEHVLRVGSAGSGKTTQILFWLLQLAACVKTWVFDLRKREFAKLAPYLRRVGVQLVVVPARELRINPLEVPSGVDPRDYASNCSEMLIRVLKLPPRATKLLHVTILRLYEATGVLDGKRIFPTMFDLYESVATNAQANPQARQAIVDSLEPVLLSIGSVVRYRNGWTGALHDFHIAFELGGVSVADADLLLNTIIMQEFMRRLARMISNVPLDLVVVCDEAARLVGSADSSLSDLITVVRGAGIGLDLTAQTAEVSRTILGNVANRCVFRLTNAADYQVMASSMGMTAEQKQWLAQNLVPGLCCMSVGQGTWTRPFLAKVPNLRLRPIAYSDQTADLGPLWAIPTVEATEFRGWQPPWARKETISPGPQPTYPATDGLPKLPKVDRSKMQSDKAIEPDEELFLKAVLEHPCQPVSFYPRHLHIAARRAIKLREELIKKGLIREETLATGQRGRPPTVLVPTEKARNLFS